MLPHYKVHTPNNDLATTATAIRAQTYLMFKRFLPALDEDFELASKHLSSLTGVSVQRAADIIASLYRLKELPKLEELQESLFHLDFSRLIAIDRVLNKLELPDREVLARIDDALTTYLTPRRAGQELPSVRNLRRKINMLVAAEDPRLGLGETDEEALKRRHKGIYDSYPLPGGMGCIDAQYDVETAAQLDAAITRTADEYGVSKSQALAMLILTDIPRPADVVLNVYSASDRPDSPVYIEDFGWADPATGQRLTARATTVRDMDKAARAESESYVTPELIKAYINGRDGHCRYPGCSRPASKCQKDHCVDFKDGGPTAAWNLVNLCQHHHNIKTDKRAKYVIDPATDDVVWLFADGTWEATVPEGPLSPDTCNWFQTIEQAITARKRNAHERAKAAYEERKEYYAKLDQEADPDYWSEPPF